MKQTPADASLLILNFLLIAADVIVYFAFGAIAVIRNRIAKREALNRRITGAVGVILFSVFVSWYALTHLVNERVLSSLPPFQQGQYVGEIGAIPLFPALVVLGVVGIREWLAARRKRKIAGGT